MADTAREASETWEYHEHYTAPLLAKIGLAIEIAPHDLSKTDIYGLKGDLQVPVYTETGKFPTHCSDEWKLRVFRRYLRSLGYGPDRPVVTWLGFSLDEIQRLKHSDVQWQSYHWPLCYDVPMTRGECAALVRSFGWPEPPKSSCYICPHRQNGQWRRLRDIYPDDWQKAVELDYAIRDRDPLHAVYLHRSRMPLDQADLGNDEETAAMLGCESGFCWT